MAFQAGDMCTIVAPPGVEVLRHERWILGRTVVLLDHNCDQDGQWPPYWRCTGLKHEGRGPGTACSGVAEIALRKIPPPELSVDDVFDVITDVVMEHEKETHNVT